MDSEIKERKEVITKLAIFQLEAMADGFVIGFVAGVALGATLGFLVRRMV